MRRGLVALGIAPAAALTAVSAVVLGHTDGVPGPVCISATQVLANSQVARLEEFTSWLVRNHAAGYVGEVGWPGESGWNAVASAWYTAADRAQLWVTAWSAAQGWPADYPMAAYRLPGAAGAATGSRGPQAEVIEAHPTSAARLRGVDLPSGAFGATATGGVGGYSNATPGTFGLAYYYPGPAAYRYLVAQKVSVVRISFTWERLQPTLGGPLDRFELQRLRQTVTDASAAGLGVILDLHSFGGYEQASGPGAPPRRLALGSSALPESALADLWARLSVGLRGVPGLTGYDLMNEPGALDENPVTGAAIWQRASQAAVDGLRAVGDRRTVLVEGYAASGPEQFVRFHPRAWIHDPAHAVRYEIHQYFDTDGSGSYRQGFALTAGAATRSARRSGVRVCARSARPGRSEEAS